jgi:4-amino-4-deoxy-L-arabinose transferase-like glycosyltransferase
MLWRLQASIPWIRIVEVLISMLSTWLFFLLGREMNDVKAGVAAFLVSSFYFPLIWLIPPILSENLWICFILLSYLLLWKANNKSFRFAGIIGSILMLAIATLIRPAAVFLLPFYCVWAIRKSYGKYAVGMVALYFAILLPWNLHMFRQEGHPVFIASEGNVTLWTGTHPSYSGEGDLSVNPAVQSDYRQILKDQPSDAERQKLYAQQAVENITSDPFRYLKLELKKILYWILPIGPSILQSSLLHRVVGIGFYVPLLMLAFWAMRTATPDIRFFVIGIIVSFTVMILIFFPQERFRIATIDPILLLLASNSISDRLSASLR